MKKLLIILIAVVIFAFVHEGLHALVASYYGEYDAFHIRPFGLEVTVKTPTTQRQGFMWAIFSGLPNLVTTLIGYLLYASRRLASLSNSFLRSLAYFSTLIFMLFDPLNLSIIPFLFGGDINGIAVGTRLPPLLIQVVALLVLFLNRELIARHVLPAINVVTDHPFFKPWLSRAS
jgi:hypothetical protein